jgi:hypothetical protein
MRSSSPSRTPSAWPWRRSLSWSFGRRSVRHEIGAQCTVRPFRAASEPRTPTRAGRNGRRDHWLKSTQIGATRRVVYEPRPRRSGRRTNAAGCGFASAISDVPTPPARRRAPCRPGIPRPRFGATTIMRWRASAVRAAAIERLAAADVLAPHVDSSPAWEDRRCRATPHGHGRANIERSINPSGPSRSHSGVGGALQARDVVSKRCLGLQATPGAPPPRVVDVGRDEWFYLLESMPLCRFVFKGDPVRDFGHRLSC